MRFDEFRTAVDVNAPLPIEVTEAGFEQVISMARCPDCKEELPCCSCPLGDPDSYPTDEEFAQMQAKADKLPLRALDAAEQDAEHIPTLAERLADSIRDDR